MREYTCAEIDLLAYLQKRLTREEFEGASRHVTTCQDCQRDLVQLEQTYTLLPIALAPVDPPKDLKAKVLAQAFEQRPPADTATVKTGNVPAASHRKHSHFAQRVLPWALSAALFVVSLGLSQQVVHDREQLRGLQGQLARATMAVDLQPTRVLQSASGKAVVIPTTNGVQLIVYISHVKPTQGREVYHVWLWNHGTRKSAGVITTTTRGSGALQVSLNGARAQFDGIGITLEPSAATNVPTGPKVLGASSL